MLGPRRHHIRLGMRSDVRRHIDRRLASNLRATSSAISRVLRAPVLHAHVNRITLTPHACLAYFLWIDGLWLLGVFALSVRSLGGWWISAALRFASPLKLLRNSRRFRRISKTLGLHRPLRCVSPSHRQPDDHRTLRALVLLSSQRRHFARPRST